MFSRKTKRKVREEVELLGEQRVRIMDTMEAAASLRKMKKKQAKNDPIEQAKMKKKRLEKALATSAAIRSELLKKKQKKKEEQERLDEERWASLGLSAGHRAAQVASDQQLGDDLVVDVIEFPRRNQLTSSELDEPCSSPFKYKTVPQHSINGLHHFFPDIIDCVPSFPRAGPSNAATRGSREKDMAKENVGRKRNGGSLHIRLEDLQPHFGKKIEHTPIQELGVGRSTVKEGCRGIYIKKNPSLVDAARTSHDSRRTNLPAPNILLPPTELQMESETVMVKARYEDEIIKFKFLLSSTMKKLQEEVGRRLDLEIGSFKLRYLDEDDDKILLACDDDLQLCIKSLTPGDKTTMQLFVHNK